MVVDVDGGGGTAVLTRCASPGAAAAAARATTPVATVSSAVSTTSASATTTVGALEASVDLDVDFLLLLGGAGLGGVLGLKEGVRHAAEMEVG